MNAATTIADPDEAVREALAELYAAHGQLTPALVLNAARAPDSALHAAFEWDDNTAAEAWREE